MNIIAFNHVWFPDRGSERYRPLKNKLYTDETHMIDHNHKHDKNVIFNRACELDKVNHVRFPARRVRRASYH